MIKGQNNIETPFENPWENSKEFNFNYNHPGFPTPPVSYLYEFNFGSRAQIKRLYYLILSLDNNNYSEKKLSSKIRLRF